MEMIKEEPHSDLEDDYEGTLLNVSNIKKEDGNMQDIRFVSVKSENQPNVDILKVEPDLDSYASSSPAFYDVKKEECVIQDVSTESIEEESCELTSSSSKDETDKNVFVKEKKAKGQNDSAYPFICDECKRPFNSKANFKRHKCFHPNRPFVCNICNISFMLNRNLKKHQHKKNHFVDTFVCVDTPVFQCEFCPTTCRRKADLRIHIEKLHTSDKPVKCKRCGKSFPDRYTCKIHNRSHDGEKCFKCDLCPYASVTQRHLASHKLVHTNQKPYQCHRCDQTFRQKQLLRRHQNLYHNPKYVRPAPREKTHECTQCGKPFRHKGNLLRHMALHGPKSSAQEKTYALVLGYQKKIQQNVVGISKEEPHSNLCLYYYPVSHPGPSDTKKEDSNVQDTVTGVKIDKQLNLEMIKEEPQSDSKDSHEETLSNVSNIKKEDGNKQDICFVSVKSENQLSAEVESHSNSDSNPLSDLGPSDIKKEDSSPGVTIEQQSGGVGSGCASGYVSQCPPTIYLVPTIPTILGMVLVNNELTPNCNTHNQ